VPPSPRRTTVLVVEDDAALRDLYRTELTMEGYRVVAVGDGMAALQWLEGERPDAIVLDLGLPRLGGLDLHRELRSHTETRDIPIIVVTGVSAEQSINPADFSCVIRKPIDTLQLITAVRKCLPPARNSLP
jgi:CheY-like chemotaxis protein